MVLPISVDTKNITTTLFTGAIILALVCGFLIGKLIEIAIKGGFDWLFLIFILILTACIFVCIKIINKVFPEIKKVEIMGVKLMEEQIVNEIVNQDFKLLQMKIMENEYNMKVKEWNKHHKIDTLNEIKWRDMESLANQAFDKDFYEKTYGYRLNKNLGKNKVKLTKQI